MVMKVLDGTPLARGVTDAASQTPSGRNPSGRNHLTNAEPPRFGPRQEEQRRVRSFALEKGVEGLARIGERAKGLPQPNTDQGGRSPKQEHLGAQPVRLRSVVEQLQNRRPAEVPDGAQSEPPKTGVRQSPSAHTSVPPVGAARPEQRPDTNPPSKSTPPVRTSQDHPTPRPGKIPATNPNSAPTSVVTSKEALLAAVNNPPPPTPAAEPQTRAGEKQQSPAAPATVQVAVTAPVAAPVAAPTAESASAPMQMPSSVAGALPVTQPSSAAVANRYRPAYELITGKDLPPGIISPLPPKPQSLAEHVPTPNSGSTAELRAAGQLHHNAAGALPRQSALHPGSAPSLIATDGNLATSIPPIGSSTDKNRPPAMTLTSPPEPHIFGNPLGNRFASVEDVISRITKGIGRHNARFLPGLLMSDLRDLSFGPEQLEAVRRDPAVGEIRKHWSVSYREELDLRLTGRKAEAEAINLRRTITSGEIKTEEGKANASSTLKGGSKQIQDAYQKKYGRDLRKDLKEALGVRFSDPPPASQFSEQAKSRALVDKLD